MTTEHDESIDRGFLPQYADKEDDDLPPDVPCKTLALHVLLHRLPEPGEIAQLAAALEKWRASTCVPDPEEPGLTGVESGRLVHVSPLCLAYEMLLVDIDDEALAQMLDVASRAAAEAKLPIRALEFA